MTQDQPLPRRGGRPPKHQAGVIEDKILDSAAALFFSEGYGATSIEEIARRAQISKRTFYARYDSKKALFCAVVQRLVQRLRPGDDATDRLFHGKDIRDSLRQIAQVMLKASLSPQALALHRLMLAEAARFPELAQIMNEQSARQEAIIRIAALLCRESGVSPNDAAFAAEQFMMLVSAAPQRRALGLGTPMTEPEIEAWIAQTIDLFIGGYRMKA